MRRLLLSVPLLAGILVVTAACSSGTGTKRTVTVVNTIASASGPATATSGASSGSAASSGASVTVVGPSGSATTGSTHASSPSASATKPSPSVPATPTPPPFVKVDPLQANCSTILSSTDVQKALGGSIDSGSNRKKDVANPSRGVTGKVRCYYPSVDAKGEAPVVVALTKYSSADAAKKQIKITYDAETDKGAVVSETTTPTGYPANIMLRDGGFIIARYNDWTVGIATDPKVAANAKLTAGLPVLAGQVISRIVKNS